MNDEIIPVNKEALARAMITVVGEENTALITKAYQALDQAMAYGYEKSQSEEAEKHKVMAEDYVAALQRSEVRDNEAAFKRGYDAGYQDGDAAGYNHGLASAADGQDSYDDGYVDGVQDYRSDPDQADERVAALCYADELHDDFEGGSPWPDDEVDDYDHQADEDGFDGRYEAPEGWDFDPSEYSVREGDELDNRFA